MPRYYTEQKLPDYKRACYVIPFIRSSKTGKTHGRLKKKNKKKKTAQWLSQRDKDWPEMNIKKLPGVMEIFYNLTGK